MNTNTEHKLSYSAKRITLNELGEIIDWRLH